MAFADQGMNSSRATALGVVLLLHIGLFGALALYRPDILKKIVAPIEAVQVKDEAPPPEEPPPPPPKDLEIPPYVPPPEVSIASEPAPAIITTQTATPAPQPPVFNPPAPPAPPAAAPPAGPTQRATANARVFEVSEDDYPPSSLRAEEEGVVAVTVNIGVSGRVEGCSVTTSSNFPKLDERTCKIAQSRWRFKPALQNGTPVPDTISKRIRWQINRK